MSEATPKFCATCAHVRKLTLFTDPWTCCAPQGQRRDVVTGLPEVRWCRELRNSGAGCGPDAAWFEAMDDDNTTRGE
jgi:hypothetical protein